MPPRRATAAAALVLAAGLASGCAARQPVLYPNAHLQRVGAERARADVAACTSQAHSYVRSGRLPETAGRAAEGAAVGGAAGAAAGAVLGRPGRGAAAGAAGAATGVVARSLFRRGPDPVERAYVTRCLRERGYEPIGWR